MPNQTLYFYHSEKPEVIFEWVRANVPKDSIVRLCADELSWRKIHTESGRGSYVRCNGDWFYYKIVVEQHEDASRIAARWIEP